MTKTGARNRATKPPAAYKHFGEVLNSVEQAGLAKTVAKLKVRFVIKDAVRRMIEVPECSP